MNKRKGFTLIELLAVIVILGLLMAIAIPSVTKYITESRKKTLTTTVGNYISALVNEVNDLSYTFTGQNTIYAVPIECIALERGGTNPFGHWYQANDAYFAYVLIQYDDVNSKYVYGFTFKDSAGYGLYPTIQANINEKGSQIKTNLEIKKPRNGSIEKVASKVNWNGFNVNDDTQLKVLKATSEGEIGDGINTCTLVQKASNYEQVQPKIDDLTLVKYAENTYFWTYSEQIKNIIFENSIDIPYNAYKSWDVSLTHNGKVMAYIISNSSDSSYYDLYIQGDEYVYANKDSSYLFLNFKNVENIINIGMLNTSRVTSMYHMFARTGSNAPTVNIDGLENWDTSSVINMSFMFQETGKNATIINISGLNNWDTSNVNDMTYMFHRTGESATTFNIGDLSAWDTSNVTNMMLMFCYAGCSASWSLDCSSWNVDKVINYANFNYSNTSNIISPQWKN